MRIVQSKSCRAWMCALKALAGAVLAILLGVAGTTASALVQTTTVQGTVYRANGTPASGTVLISWPAFTTADNEAVAAGHLSAPIGTNGFLSVNLTPNAGGIPAGSYYTVVYHLSDGTVSPEYWIVPASGTATISSVRARLEPSTVAVQGTVTPAYVQGALNSLSSNFLPLGGGTLDGPLTLSSDPSGDNQAATKHYTDQMAALDLPLTGGTLKGPLTVPALQTAQFEGRLFADQKQTNGSNGIVQSLAECKDLTYPCEVVAPPSYSDTEAQPFGAQNTSGSGMKDYLGSGGAYIRYGPTTTQPTAAVLDYRYGVPQWFYNAGTDYPTGNSKFFASPTDVMNVVKFPSAVGGQSAMDHVFQTSWFMGGMNETNPQCNSDCGSAYKNNLGNLSLWSWKYTSGQNGGDLSQNLKAYGLGDNVGHTIQITNWGGPNSAGDEGTELERFQQSEGSTVFGAKIQTLTTASDGSMTIVPYNNSTLVANGSQGQGRFIIDTTAGFSSSASGGQYVSSISTSDGNITITCATTYCDPKATDSTTQTTTTDYYPDPVPSTNTFPVSGAVIPVASTAGFAAGQTACIWGEDFDCEKVTSVGAGSITFATLRIPVPKGAWVTTGGLTGYAFSFAADSCTASSPSPACAIAPPSGQTIRWAIPILKSSGNAITLSLNFPSLPGGGTYYTGRAYTQMGGSGGSVSFTLSGGVATGCSVTSGGSGYVNNRNPPQIQVSGTYTTAPTAYVTAVNGGAVTGCAVSSGGSGVTAATGTFLAENDYSIYPTAKVYQVYDPAAGAVNGTLWTEPSTGTFAENDMIEQPHWYIQHDQFSLDKVATDIPSPASAGNGGSRHIIYGYQGNDAADDFANYTNPLAYHGYPAGTPGIPGLGQWSTPTGYKLEGPFSKGISMDTPPYGDSAGSAAAVYVGCGKIGCSKWTGGYSFLSGQNSNGGSDILQYDPANGNWMLSAGASLLGGNSPQCSYRFGATGSSFSISCSNKISSFDTSGDLTLSGMLEAQGGVTAATINGELTVDGTTYKTLNAAWSAAASRASSTGQDQTVWLGPGTYPVTATLTEPTNGACVNLLGSGGTTVTADSTQAATTLTVPSALNGDVFLLGNTAQAQGCTFKDFNILAQKNATHGFELQWFRGLLIDNVTVNDTTAAGIVLGEENTSAGHQSNFLLRNVTVSYSSAAFTPASRPAYGIQIQETAMDSDLEDITVRNALTAAVFNEGTGNTGVRIHGFGYPYTCTTAPCANNASSSTAANASYATSYVIYDTGGAGSVWTDTYVDSPAVAGFYIGANGVSINGGHIQWPDLTSFPNANLAYVASNVTNNLLIADVDCLGMNSGVNWITYGGSAGNPPTFSSVHHLTGCGNYYQALEPAETTGFSSGGANINDPSGAVPRVWSTPIAAAANYPAYSAQLYTGYQGDAFQAHYSGVAPFFNVTSQGTIRSNGGMALSTVINTASTVTLTTANRNVIANASSGAQTITLPSCYTPMADRSSPTGLELTIIKSDPSANAVTLQTVSSQNIDYNGVSAQTLTISSPGKRTLICGPDYNWYAY